jgi:uncharacterized membrane protein (DUF485 family)
MDLRSPVVKEKEDAAVVSYNTRLGLMLFAVYTAVYGGFMLLSAFEPQLMSRPFLGGVNLAIIYGFALIASAIILALAYLKLCRKS